MSEQQLFLGDPVVIQFTAQRSADRGWTLITRVVNEYQDWGSARFDEYSELSGPELQDLIPVVLEGLRIL